MYRRIITLLSTGAITLIATFAVIFLSMKNWEGLAPAAAIFIIWAEIILFGGLLVVEKFAASTAQTFFRASVTPVLLIYSILVIISSVIFLNFFRFSTTAFWVIQIVLFALLAILLIVLYFASNGVKESSTKSSVFSGVKEGEI